MIFAKLHMCDIKSIAKDMQCKFLFEFKMIRKSDLPRTNPSIELATLKSKF